MPYARPTFTQIFNQAIQDINSSDLPGVVGGLRKSVLRVLSYVLSGQAWEHYGFLDWISKQAVPWTATDEFLQAWAALRGVIPEDATSATGFVNNAGGTVGVAIPLGTAFTRSDGVAFISTASVSVQSGGTASVPLKAVTPGANTNCDAGIPFNLTTPIAGINSTFASTALFVGGSDPETTDAFRTRMLLTYAQPPQGGSATDYVEWALQVPGVTRAWVTPNGNGVGTVVVYFMMDQTEVAHNGFPQGTNGGATLETRTTPAVGDQLLVADHIFPLRPVTALVYAYAPVAQPVNFTIANLLPFTPDIEAAITLALTNLFVSQGSVGGTFGGTGGTFYGSDLEAAISAIPGLTHFTLSAPSGPVTATAGNLLTIGTMTFTP